MEPRTAPGSAPHRRRGLALLPPWALTIAVLTGQAMAALDTSIVNVGGPSIQHNLHLSAAGLQLAIYSYVLVYAVALIVGARLGGRYGYGRMFAWGTALFTVSSLACGLAVGPVMLVAARAAQGVGAALLVPQVLSLLQITFVGEKRRRALTLYGTILAVGVAAGQIIGGFLISANLFGAGWRPIFLVNVPLGVIVLAFSAGRLPAGSRSNRGRLDLVGAGLLAAAILALVTPLTFGNEAGWPAWCWPVMEASAVALLAFGIHENRLVRVGRDPLIHPALVAPREVRAGLVGIFVLMGCYGGLLFTSALYLQHIQHYSPLRCGLTFAAYAGGFALTSLTWFRLPMGWHRAVPAISF
ncbi:MAG: MFS transporter, partial [Frankia sp.]